MAFMRINGVTVPVDVGSAGEEPQLVEDAQRTEGASLLVDRRAEKGKWNFDVIFKNAANATAWRKFIHGEGQYLSFDTSLYSSKGLAPSASVGGPTIGAAAPLPWLGAGRVRVVSSLSGSITYTALRPGATDGWTVAVARNVNNVSWIHYIVNSLGQKWGDGARNDVLGTAWLTVSTVNGTVKLDADATFDTFYDELIVYPFALPIDWPPQLYLFQAPVGVGGEAKQIGVIRALKLDGDAVDDGVARSVIGRVSGVKVRHSKTSGAKTPLRSLSVNLEEV